jgi:hypothetical protein
MTVLRSSAATYFNLNWRRKNSGSEFPANAGLVVCSSVAATSAVLRGKSIEIMQTCSLCMGMKLGLWERRGS